MEEEEEKDFLLLNMAHEQNLTPEKFWGKRKVCATCHVTFGHPCSVLQPS